MSDFEERFTSQEPEEETQSPDTLNENFAVPESPEQPAQNDSTPAQISRYERKANKKRAKMPMGAWLAIITASGLLAGMIGGFLAGCVFKGNSVFSGNTSNVMEGKNERTIIKITEVDTSKEMTAAEVYAASVNSAVGITTQVTTNYWGYKVTSPASGSGFVYSDDGYIITNYHVVEDASSISVTTYNGDKYTAKLVGFDESNDVAVLKIEATGLSPVVLGDFTKTNIGDPVVAIGNPLGELTFSLTQGAVSALNRTVTLSNGMTMNLLQTDCAINSGNSGGPLFNMFGECIGITNAKYSNSGSGASIDNIAFAIPINTVRPIIESIMEKGYVSKSYIGISITDVAEQYLNFGLPKGAAVQSVDEGSPAEQGGIKVNDIITKADDTVIEGKDALISYVGAKKPGDRIALTVYRQGQIVELDVTVIEKIQGTSEQSQQQEQLPQQQPSQGFGNFFPFNFGF